MPRRAPRKRLDAAARRRLRPACVPVRFAHGNWRAIACLLLCWVGDLLAATDQPHWPEVLACDAVDGIVVIEHDGIEQALVRGQVDRSGEWRVTQVGADSAMLESVVDPGMRIRAYLAGSGRSPIKFAEQPPPSSSARSVVTSRARAQPVAAEDR